MTARRAARAKWTPEMEATLIALYPTTTVVEIAERIGMSASATYNRAYKLGLQKPDSWASECTRRRWAEGRHENSRAAQFQPGHIPHNKGRRRPGFAPGRMRETQFKAGEMRGAARHNYRPIGSLRVTKDGHVERKVTDDHPVPARRWVAVHRLVWEAAHGSIPPGHIVVFKRGRRTTVEAEITPDRLELISRVENMRRNTRHNRYSLEVNQVIQLAGALKRKINNRAQRLGKESLA